MNINFSKICKDIRSENKQVFLMEFENIEYDIKEFILKPISNISRKNLQEKLLGFENLKEKLEIIYGESIEELDMTCLPFDRGYSLRSVTKKIKFQEYEAWFKEYTSDPYIRLIKTFSTFYNPSTDEVIFTGIINEK